MAAESQTLKVVLRLVDVFTTPMRKALGYATTFGRGVVSVFKSVTRQLFSLKGAAVGLFSVFAARAGIRSVQSLIEMEDATAKLARSVGSTTEEVSGLQFAMEAAGISGEKFNEIMNATSRQIAAALRNTGLQRQAFADLGITVDDLRNKGVVEIFLQMARGLERFNDVQTRGQVLSKIYTENFRRLAVLFEGGEKGLRDLIGAAEYFGAVVSTRSGKQAERFDDTLLALRSTIQGITRTVLDEFLPSITTKFAQAADFLARNKERIAQFFIALGETIAQFVKTALAGFLRVGQAVADFFGIFRTKTSLNKELNDIERNLRQIEALRKEPGREGQFARDKRELEAQRARVLAQLQDAYRLDESLAKLRKSIGEVGDGWDDSRERGKSAIQNWLDGLEKLRGLPADAFRDLVPTAALTTEQRKSIAERLVLEKQVVAARLDGQKRALALLEADYTRERLAIVERGRLEAENGDDRVQIEQDVQNRLLVLRADYNDRAKALLDSYADQSAKAGERVSTAFEDAGRQIGSGLVSNVGSLIGDLTDKTKSWTASWRDAKQQIVRALTEIAAKLLFIQAIRLVAPGLGEVLGLKGLASGGYTGGVGLAGITNGPIIIGEGERGRRREAVVPLPDNRSIPVQFVGGGGGPQNVANYYFQPQFLDTRDADRWLRERGKQIAATMVDQASRNTPYRRSHGI